MQELQGSHDSSRLCQTTCEHKRTEERNRQGACRVGRGLVIMLSTIRVRTTGLPLRTPAPHVAFGPLLQEHRISSCQSIAWFGRNIPDRGTHRTLQAAMTLFCTRAIFSGGTCAVALCFSGTTAQHNAQQELH